MSGNMNFAPTTSMAPTESRSLGQDILEIYGPLLNLKLDSKPGIRSEEEVKKGLKKVNQFLESKQKKYKQLDEDISTLRKARHIKSTALSKKVKECNSTLQELDGKISLQNSDEYISALVDYLNKADEETELKIGIKRLERIIQCNPPKLVESLDKAAADLQVAIKELEASCKEKDNLVSQYEQLGSKFQDLRRKHEAQEEEIKTKLWVKEQLEMGCDDTLNESLF